GLPKQRVPAGGNLDAVSSGAGARSLSSPCQHPHAECPTVSQYVKEKRRYVNCMYARLPHDVHCAFIRLHLYTREGKRKSDSMPYMGTLAHKQQRPTRACYETVRLFSALNRHHTACPILAFLRLNL